MIKRFTSSLLIQLAPLFAFGLLLANPFSALAQSKNIGDCQKGHCWEIYILGKRLIRQYQLGRDKRTIYLVNLKTISDGKATRDQNWVQCSTSEPFVAFLPSPGLPGQSSPKEVVVIHYINPGGKFIANYERGSHKIYWAVCHNIFRDHPYDMGQIARRLGYSSQLPSNQREVPRAIFNP